MKLPNRNKIAELVAKAAIDEEVKAKLLNDPHKALKEIGGEFSKNDQIKILENTRNEFHFVVPNKKLQQQYEVENISPSSSFSDIAYWVITQIQKNGKNRERILNDIRGALKEKMIHLSKNTNIFIHENTENLFYLVIPRKIAFDEQLNDFELKQVAGGKSEYEKGLDQTMWQDIGSPAWNGAALGGDDVGTV